MQTARQKYTYFISLDGGTNYTQFYPTRGAILHYKKQDGEMFYRVFCQKEITISRLFRNNAGAYSNQTLFDALVNKFYDRFELSTEVKVLIKNNYTGTAVDKWLGYFSISEIELDLDAGVLTFIPLPDDAYRYLIKYGDIEVDITDIVGITENTVTVQAVSAEEVCYRDDMDTTPCSETDDGDWAYCGNITYASDPEIYAQYGLDPDVNYRVFKRQRANFEPHSSTGWYQSGAYWYKDTCTQEVVETYIYGFMYVYQLIEGILDYMRGTYTDIPSITLYSQFILNSDGPPMLNYITGEPNFVRYLQISQKSNVRLVDPSDFATKANLTFNKLMSIYKQVFDAWWYIEPSTGYLRVEHRKFFEWGLNWQTDSFSPDVDLTDDTYYSPIYQRKIQKYSYPSISYNYEEWAYMEAGYAAFRKEDTVIEYGYELDKRTALTHDLSYITADIQYIFDAPDRIADDGFVLAFCDPSLIVVRELIIDAPAPTYTLNGPLCIPNMIHRYHRYGRLCMEGEIDGDPTVFLSEKRLRLGNPVVYTVNEADVDGVDPYKAKRTKLITGAYASTTQDGEIDTALHDLEDDLVELTLLFANGASSTETFNIMINGTDAILADADDTLISQ